MNQCSTDDNMAEKRISVCMASHNGMPFIKDQIKSIISQLGENDELIISDDGSTDGTLEYLDEIKDPRLRVLSYKGPVPPSKNKVFAKMQKIKCNFENCLKNACGDIIVLSDQDDIWDLNKLSYIRDNMRSKCMIHDAIVIDSHNEVIGEIKNYSSTNIMNIFMRPPFMGCCMVVCREVVEKCLPFPEYPLEHDTYLGLAAKASGSDEIVFVEDKLINYRRHGSNASPCFEGSKNSLWVKFMRRFYMLKCYLRLLKKYRIN